MPNTRTGLCDPSGCSAYFYIFYKNMLKYDQVNILHICHILHILKHAYFAYSAYSAYFAHCIFAIFCIFPFYVLNLSCLKYQACWTPTILIQKVSPTSPTRDSPVPLLNDSDGVGSEAPEQMTPYALTELDEIRHLIFIGLFG